LSKHGTPPSRWNRRALALAPALIAGVLLPFAALAAKAPSTLEQAVKASYLVKFAPFVEWPPRAFPPGSKSFLICIAGEDPFGAVVDEVARGQKVAGRPVALQRLPAGAGPGACQILFLGRSAQAASGDAQSAAGQPVLTVTDRGNGAAGGMIQFVMQSGRVRFQIDEGAARANGLTISSKLLELAIAVDRK
jgi:hypothetical protein